MLRNTRKSRIVTTTEVGSGSYGLVLEDAWGTLVWHSEFNANGRAGVYLEGSRYNRLQGNIVENNHRWGIVLARGSGHNVVAFNWVLGSGVDDLVDSNPSCDANRWQHDRFRTHNQPCAT